MRISDWSSDVCSSDLFGDLHRHHQLMVNPLSPRRHDGRGERIGFLRSLRTAIGSFHARIHPSQIGRASCRERVCQYVSISVVAVAFKKKEIQYTVNSNDTTYNRRKT